MPTADLDSPCVNGTLAAGVADVINVLNVGEPETASILCLESFTGLRLQRSFDLDFLEAQLEVQRWGFTINLWHRRTSVPHAARPSCA